MPSLVAVESTDSEREISNISILVTIIIFTERDIISMQTAELITQGIKKAAQLSGSQAK